MLFLHFQILILLLANVKNSLQEAVYCPISSTGFLEWGIKNSRKLGKIPEDKKRSATNKAQTLNGPKRARYSDHNEPENVKELIETLKKQIPLGKNLNSIKDNMQKTFKNREDLRNSMQSACLLQEYPRFLDCPGLVIILKSYLSFVVTY